jgi:hypothetical protein
MSEKIEKKEIDDFEEWYENQIWGNEDFKECLLQAWLGRAKQEVEPLSIKAAKAMDCVIAVDNLLSEAGYLPDCSMRHNLDHAKSWLREIAFPSTESLPTAEQAAADMRRDAERYRWMKANVKRIPPAWALIGWDTAIDAQMLTESLPAADTAMEESEPAWQPIETAPKDVSVLLYCNEYLPIYCGRKRYGNLGEPQQDVFAWRCDSSGRFANPTLWAHIPPAPQTTLNCGHIPTSSIELLGMWEPADFEGGSEEVRGPDWKLE